MEENSKKISIIGTNNRYQIKKIINEYKEEKHKRVESKKWLFSNEHYEYQKQLQMIIDISNNNYNFTNDISKIAIKEIVKKISGYKQQDILKKRYDETQFLTYKSIICTMIDCELKCRYCKNEMNVLYDISREMNQWSVDRIKNELGHNIDNYHLACLDCNLKRRRRTDESFLFTKQLNIVKQDN
jgi:hypothetical protein